MKSTSGTRECGGGNKCRFNFPGSEICCSSCKSYVSRRVPKQAVKGEYYLTPMMYRSLCSFWILNFQSLLFVLPVLILARLGHMCSVSGVAVQQSVLERCFHSCPWLRALATPHVDNTRTYTHSHTLSKLPAKVSQFPNTAESGTPGMKGE